MNLYIDPGTGSMLFAILIGVIGALNYLLKGWIIRLRFLFSGGKKEEITEGKIPYAIFSDDKRYWNVFEPVCRELDKRGVDVVYMTASPDDPALNNTYEHIKAEFIGEGNKAFSKLNFLKASVLLSTTPGLDVYQWKRSKDVDFYVHMMHGANEIAGYRMFGVDYYDAVLVSGEYQIRDLRCLEAKRNLPPKEVIMVGIPYMDKMEERLNAARKEEKGEPKEKTTVLIAPSWGKSSILNKFGGKVITVLLDKGYHVIIRPHPQSFTSEAELTERLMKEFPESENLEWNRDNDNFDVLKRTDILLSDFSGIIFDMALVYDKPVIYADTEFDKGPYDFWWLDDPIWTFEILPEIGQKLTEDNVDKLDEIVKECLNDPKYALGRDKARAETWVYPGEGAKRIADYLTEKYNEINKISGEEKKDDVRSNH